MLDSAEDGMDRSTGLGFSRKANSNYVFDPEKDAENGPLKFDYVPEGLQLAVHILKVD